MLGKALQMDMRFILSLEGQERSEYVKEKWELELDSEEPVFNFLFHYYKLHDSWKIQVTSLYIGIIPESLM